MPLPRDKSSIVKSVLLGAAFVLLVIALVWPELLFGAAMRGRVLGIAAFIVAFGLAVLVHELGHFLAAKAFKVPVERFVIGFDRDAMPGMPRCIWERKIGETTYGLSLMPLGGYVKMSGIVHPDIEAYLEGKDREKEAKKNGTKNGAPQEEQAVATPPPEKQAVRDDSLTGQAIMDQAALYKKPYYQKLIIYSAGVLMNLLLAMLLMVFLDVRGRTVPVPLPAVVAWQAPDSWLLENDIRQHDRIVAVNGEAIEDSEDWARAIRALLPEEEKDYLGFTLAVHLTLERDGEQIERELELTFPETMAELRQFDSDPRLGAFYGIISIPAYVEFVGLDAPAYKAGIKRGDFIRVIDGEPVDDWRELLHIVRASMGKELTIEVERNGAREIIKVTPWEDNGVGQIGITGGNPNTRIEKKALGEAIAGGPARLLTTTVNYTRALGQVGKRLVQGDIEKVRRDLGGPVTIARAAGYTANINFEYYVGFLIIFNIALAIINILPIPILDGGHIVLASFEAVFRRPVPPKVLVPVLNGAFIVLIGLFLLITFSDVLKWLS